MYSLDDILKGIRNTEKIGREMNRLYHRKMYTWEYNLRGDDIFSEDWDNLIILDACRYDTFRDIAGIEGELHHRESKGSTTFEWVRANFKEKNVTDTVYVSANVWFYRLEDRIECRIHDFIHSDGVDWTGPNPSQTDAYDRGTHPELVVEDALEAAERYPNKRLLVHFMQPHAPFVGTFGDDRFGPTGHLMAKVSSGEIDATRGEVEQGYRENLEFVLPYVEELVGELEGKTVVSADHGEMLGDRYRPFPFADYGHNPGIYTDQLVRVPWLEVPYDTRRSIVAEEPVERSYESDQEMVKEQLEDLGYVL